MNEVETAIKAWKKTQVTYIEDLAKYTQSEDEFYGSYISILEENFNDFLGVWRLTGEEISKKKTTEKPSAPTEPLVYAGDNLESFIFLDSSNVGWTSGAGAPTFG